jgi:hypothetical protein
VFKFLVNVTSNGTCTLEGTIATCMLEGTIAACMLEGAIAAWIQVNIVHCNVT